MFKDELEAQVGLLRFGNERINRWAACPALADPEQIAREIGWMDERSVENRGVYWLFSLLYGYAAFPMACWMG